MGPRLHIDDRQRVHLVVQVPIEFEGDPWELLLQWQTLLCSDPLHKVVEPAGAPLAQGVEFRLLHGFILGPDLWRRGRILEVRPGRGFSFSDLSLRGPRAGFPHVYRHDIVPGPSGARLRVTVKGRWTARWIPRVLSVAWLWLIALGIHGRLWGLLQREHLARRSRRRLLARKEKRGSKDLVEKARSRVV